jgi:hypothetical protein
MRTLRCQALQGCTFQVARPACTLLCGPHASVTVSFAGVRPVPLEIHIMAFDIVSFDARLQAMARPTYSGLVQASSQVTLLERFTCVHNCYG